MTLQNRGDRLPIRPEVRWVAVVGPMTDAPRDQQGPHGSRAHAEDAVSVIAGIRRRAAPAGVAVNFAAGCDLFCTNADQIGEAVEAAGKSDLVIAVLGEPHEASGEAAARAYLTFLNRQAQLLDALVKTGKPVALVIVGGRPVELGRFAESIPAVMMAWFPGTEAGPALADVLFGDVSPSGKLPVTYPRTAGQLPFYYNRLPSGRPTRSNNRFTMGYIDEAITPQFPFGWGLSYTQFAYSDVALARPQIAPGEALEVSVTVTNTGSRPGQDVVQLYTRDPVASRSRPLRELKGFEKVALAPGEKRRVTLTVPIERLGFHLEDGTYLVEPGEIQVFVGGHSQAESAGSVEIIDGLRIAPGEQRSSATLKPRL